MASYELSVGPKPLCSKGSTTTAMTVPMTGTLMGRRVKTVRPSVYLESSSGNLELRFGYLTSNDGVTWSASTTLTGYTSWISAAGWTRGTTFATPTASPLYRLVVEVRNTAGTDMECARVTVFFEIKTA
jgi:hypothetical protein